VVSDKSELVSVCQQFGELGGGTDNGPFNLTMPYEDPITYFKRLPEFIRLAVMMRDDVSGIRSHDRRRSDSNLPETAECPIFRLIGRN